MYKINHHTTPEPLVSISCNPDHWAIRIGSTACGLTPHRPSSRPTNLSSPPISASCLLCLYPDRPTHPLRFLDLYDVSILLHLLVLKQPVLDHQDLQLSHGTEGIEPQLEPEWCLDQSVCVGWDQLNLAVLIDINEG